MLNAGTSARFAQILTDQRDPLIKRWATLAAAQGMRGRSKDAELTTQITEIYSALTATLRTVDVSDLRADDASEVRGALADLSGTQARRGFTRARRRPPSSR